MLTGDGESHRFDLLVSACGQLGCPEIPAIPGTEDFEGPVFHSAEWDHEVDLAGKRVAVIGTGASAIQFVPAIADVAESLAIYQRSAPWVLPKLDRAYPAWERRLFERFPARVAAARLGMFAFFETATYGFTGRHWLMAPVPSARRGRAPARARRFRADRQGHTRLRDRLQADPLRLGLVLDPRRARTSS